MTWKLIGREYHSPPYKIIGTVQGWNVWLTLPGSLKRLNGEPIEMLKAAKSLAIHHAELNGGTSNNPGGQA